MPQRSTRTIATRITLPLFALLSMAPAMGADSHPLAARVATIYALNEHLSGRDIAVDMKGNTIHLSGQVGNAIERDLAGELAQLVEGVREVDNVLRTDAAHPPPPDRLKAAVHDANIATRIRLRLRWQMSTAGLDVEPEVENGEVRLNGSISKSTLRDQVVEMVTRTAGVQNVYSYVRLAPEAIAEERQQRLRMAEETRDDAWIKARVEKLLHFDTRINANLISVSARNAEVTLRGTVSSVVAKQAAEMIAGDTLGVSSVDSLLVIETPR